MKQVIIYDNFYGDGEAIRNLALDMKYEEPRDKNYPGVNTEMSYFSDEMREFFCWLTGENIDRSEGSACGHFRKTFAADRSKQLIHADLPNLKTVWAGVLYLNPDEHVVDETGSYRDCGTKFWRHRRLGLEHLPMDPSIAAQYGFNSLDDVKTFMETDGIDETLWSETQRIPPKFNRLVVFRPWLWHSIGGQFGENSENCRLTQLFFFEPSNK